MITKSEFNVHHWIGFIEMSLRMDDKLDNKVDVREVLLFILEELAKKDK